MEVPAGSSNAMTSSTRLASASANDSSLNGTPAASSVAFTRCSAARSRTSQPTVTILSVSPGTTMMRAARSSIRRYSASSSRAGALRETQYVEGELAPAR